LDNNNEPTVSHVESLCLSEAIYQSLLLLSFTTEVLSSEAYLSYSAKGEPGDNAVNEAFFSRLKEEWRDLFAEAETFEELKKLIKKSIAYYNEKRYHTSLNNMTPAEFTKKQLKRNLTLKSINLVW